MSATMTDDPGREDWPEDEPEDEVYFCPHGEEVPTPGGACHLCAQEDADDGDRPW